MLVLRLESSREKNYVIAFSQLHENTFSQMDQEIHDPELVNADYMRDT